MRLGQLARRLSIKPGEIVEFLQKENPGVDGGTNSRLSDDQVKRIVEALSPELLDSILSSSESDEEISLVAEESSEEETEIHVEEDVDESEVVQEDSQPLEVLGVEVIRAPKVELPGLRIVGKIDLPEPKKKEPEAESSSPDDAPFEQTSEKRAEGSFGRKRRGGPLNKRPEKNPVTLRREREEREKQKRKEAEIEKEKQRRTDNYLKKFKAPDTKPARKKIKKTIQPIVVPTRVRTEEPTSVVGKFKKWLFRE